MAQQTTQKKKTKRRKPSQKQATAGKLVQKGYSPAEAATEAGYSNPATFTSSEYFQRTILAQVDENAIVQNLQEIATQKEKPNAAISAAKEILKLNNRYPEAKMTVHKYEATIHKLLENDDIAQENQ